MISFDEEKLLLILAVEGSDHREGICGGCSALSHPVWIDTSCL